MIKPDKNQALDVLRNVFSGTDVVDYTAMSNMPKRPLDNDLEDADTIKVLLFVRTIDTNRVSDHLQRLEDIFENEPAQFIKGYAILDFVSGEFKEEPGIWTTVKIKI